MGGLRCGSREGPSSEDISGSPPGSPKGPGLGGWTSGRPAGAQTEPRDPCPEELDRTRPPCSDERAAIAPGVGGILEGTKGVPRNGGRK